MQIEDMRIGPIIYDEAIVELVAISRECAGSMVPMAAWRTPGDGFSWHPCTAYRPVTRADIAADIRRNYTEPK